MRDQGESRLAYYCRLTRRHRAQVVVVGGAVALLLTLGAYRSAMRQLGVVDGPFVPRTVFASGDDADTRNLDGIHEALLRRVVPRKAPVCYVSFNGHDPAVDFVQRMRRAGVLIERMSLSPQPFKRGRESGPSRNPKLMILPVRWLDATHVQVQCDWSGEGTRYTLARKDGRWNVVSQQMAWIS